jgi:polyisoprenoid-binding protein YceI
VGSVAGRPHAWTFQRFTADLRVKGSAPTGLEVVIETGSTATSDPALKVRLASAGLFNVALHPQASFRTSALREVSRAGEVTTYAATGLLTLAGKSHAATIPLEIGQRAEAIVARLTTTVDGAAWRRGFDSSADGVFDDRLQLEARLEFPLSGRR